MSAYKRLSCVRVRRAFPLIATALLLGSGVAAGSLQAAWNEPTDPAASAAQLVMPNCNDSAHGARQVVVERADGEKRMIEICNALDRGDISATARALSAAIDAEAGKSKFYADARMPELLSLRLDWSRTDVDTSLAADVRAQRLAAINYEIEVLERAMGGTETGR
jgi:hypothetical protein